jgi:hypothetical protein
MYVDHGRYDIDEPVRQEGGDSQKNDVAKEAVLMLLHLPSPVGGLFGQISTD